MLQEHLEKLAGFHAIARDGSVLKAANSLNISQPALTKSIRILEESLKTKLFVRHQRGMSLTPAGQILYAYCEKLLHDLPDVEKRMESPQEMSGVLKVGSYETLGVNFWPAVLKNLRREFPQLHLQISTDNPAGLWQRLNEGVLDLIVDAEPPMQERYFSKILYTDKFAIYASPEFVPPENEPPPLSFVVRAYDRDGKSIEDHLRMKKIEYQLLYSFDTFTSVRHITLAGLTYGVLPRSSAVEDVKKKRLFEVPMKGLSSFGEHRICATCLEELRRDKRITRVMNELYNSNKK